MVKRKCEAVRNDKYLKFHNNMDCKLEHVLYLHMSKQFKNVPYNTVMFELRNDEASHRPIWFSNPRVFLLR